jgi:3D (Asp-Asp-Asp) domain-containing protein
VGLSVVAGVKTKAPPPKAQTVSGTQKPAEPKKKAPEKQEKPVTKKEKPSPAKVKKSAVKRPVLSSRGGYSREDFVPTKTFKANVSAYSAPCRIQGTGSYTATGRKVYKIENGETVKVPGIAVDPRVIPLGSRVEVNGHWYLADDTGGAIKGSHLDIRLNSYSECIEWGRRTVKVTVYERRKADGN